MKKALIFCILMSWHQIICGQEEVGTWKEFTEIEGCVNQWIKDIFLASDGTLWFASSVNGITTYKDGIWKSYNAYDGLASVYCKHIVETADRTIWCLHVEGTISRFDGKQWDAFEMQENIGRVNCILGSKYDNVLWMGTSQGACRYANGISKMYTIRNGLVDSAVYQICESIDHTVWLGTQRGLSCIKNGEIENFVEEIKLDDCSIDHILALDDGAIIIATNSGLSRFKAGIWQPYPKKSNMYSDLVYIFESSDGKLWTDIGYFKTDKWYNYPEEIRIAEDTWMAYSISLYGRDFYKGIETSDGSVTIAVGGGILRYKWGEWSWIALPAKINYNFTSISDLIEGPDGSLWVSCLNGLFCFEAGFWQKGPIEDIILGAGQADDGSILLEYEDESEIFNETLRYRNGAFDLPDIGRFLGQHSDGTQWFSDYKGLYAVKNGVQQFFASASGLSLSDIQAMVETSDSTLWFGNTEGFFSFKGNIWNTVIPAQNDALVFFRMHEGDDNSIWYLCDNDTDLDYAIEFGKIEGGTKTAMSSIDDISVGTPYGLVKTHGGDLWLVQSNGLQRLKNGHWSTYDLPNMNYGRVMNCLALPDDIFLVAQGDSTYLFKEDGFQLLIAERVRAAFHEEDKTLWLGTSNGIKWHNNISWYEYRVPLNVYCIHKSLLGDYWFGTNNGVLCLHKGQWRLYTSQDGMPDYVRYINETIDGTLLFSGYGVTAIKRDTLPPYTILDFGPDQEELINSGTPVFTYHGLDYGTDEKDLTYSWWATDANNAIVQGDSTTWGRDKIVKLELSNDGLYTFYARAQDLCYNIDPTPAARSFVVDIAPPTTIITQPASGDTVGQTIPVLGYAFDDARIKDFHSYGVCFGKGTSEKEVSRWDTLITNQTMEMRGDTLLTWYTAGLHGAYQLRLFAHDSTGHHSQNTVTVYIIDYYDTINSRRGGTLSNNLDLQLYFPPNSFLDDVDIKISRLDDLTGKPVNNPQLSYTGLAFDIMPHDKSALKSGTLTLIYPDSLLSSPEKESLLRIYAWDDSTQTWRLNGGTVHKTENRIQTSIRQFWCYALFEDESQGTASFLSLVDCQPRVFNPRDAYTSSIHISFNLGRATPVTIKIFNTSGRLVKTVCENCFLMPGLNSLDWNGSDDENQPCVTGLYIVAIQTESMQGNKTVMILNN